MYNKGNIKDSLKKLYRSSDGAGSVRGSLMKEFLNSIVRDSLAEIGIENNHLPRPSKEGLSAPSTASQLSNTEGGKLASPLTLEFPHRRGNPRHN